MLLMQWCMSLSSRDSEPGFGTPPRGELLLILVKFLGMEQVPLSVLKKTRCAQGLCLLVLIIPAVAFILAGAITLSRKSSTREVGTSHLQRCFPEPLVAGTGGKLKQLWVPVLVSPLLSSACDSVTLLGHKFLDLLPGFEPVCGSLALSPEGTAQRVAA